RQDVHGSQNPRQYWSGRPDLNRRPLPPQGSALPPALRPDAHIITETWKRGSAETGPAEQAISNKEGLCDPLTLTLSLQGEGNEVGGYAVSRLGNAGMRKRGNAERCCRTATFEDGLGEEPASDWRRAVAVVSERRVAEGRALDTERSPAELYRGARSSERERYARQASRLGAERARPQPISRRSASAESSGITKLMCGSVRGCSLSVVSGRAARLLTASRHHPTRPDSPASTWPRRRGRSASAPCPRWFWPRSGTIRRCGPAQSAHPLPTSRAARARSETPRAG